MKKWDDQNFSRKIRERDRKKIEILAIWQTPITTNKPVVARHHTNNETSCIDGVGS